jgi:hypothetical protein
MSWLTVAKIIGCAGLAVFTVLAAMDVIADIRERDRCVGSGALLLLFGTALALAMHFAWEV